MKPQSPMASYGPPKLPAAPRPPAAGPKPRGGAHPHKNLGKWLHPKKGR